MEETQTASAEVLHEAGILEEASARVYVVSLKLEWKSSINKIPIQ